MGRRSGKPVKDEPIGIGVAIGRILQHPDCHIVRHELALVHVGLGQRTQFGLPLDVGAKNVARGQVDKAEVVNEEGTLGAFACPGRAEEDNVAHGR